MADFMGDQWTSPLMVHRRGSVWDKIAGIADLVNTGVNAYQQYKTRAATEEARKQQTFGQGLQTMVTLANAAKQPITEETLGPIREKAQQIYGMPVVPQGPIQPAAPSLDQMISGIIQKQQAGGKEFTVQDLIGLKHPQSSTTIIGKDGETKQVPGRAIFDPAVKEDASFKRALLLEQARQGNRESLKALGFANAKALKDYEDGLASKQNYRRDPSGLLVPEGPGKIHESTVIGDPNAAPGTTYQGNVKFPPNQGSVSSTTKETPMGKETSTTVKKPIIPPQKTRPAPGGTATYTGKNDANGKPIYKLPDGSTKVWGKE